MTDRRTQEADSLLLPEEVADLFGVGISAVRSWVRQGRISVIRTPGNRMRFTHKAIDEARDRGPDGDTNGGDASARPPDRPGLPESAPEAHRPDAFQVEARWGGCGFPLPDGDLAQHAGWCTCGATYAVHT